MELSLVASISSTHIVIYQSDLIDSLDLVWKIYHKIKINLRHKVFFIHCSININLKYSWYKDITILIKGCSLGNGNCGLECKHVEFYCKPLNRYQYKQTTTNSSKILQRNSYCNVRLRYFVFKLKKKQMHLEKEVFCLSSYIHISASFFTISQEIQNDMNFLATFSNFYLPKF